MALRAVREGRSKPLRQIKRYTRKSSGGRTVYVSDYWQRYDKPRGEWHETIVDPSRTHSRTSWVKDRAGHFVGRANAEGKTRARGVVMSGIDTTRNIRERGRYGRIKGRSKA